MPATLSVRWVKSRAFGRWKTSRFPSQLITVRCRAYALRHGRSLLRFVRIRLGKQVASAELHLATWVCFWCGSGAVFFRLGRRQLGKMETVRAGMMSRTESCKRRIELISQHVVHKRVTAILNHVSRFAIMFKHSVRPAIGTRLLCSGVLASGRR